MSEPGKRKIDQDMIKQTSKDQVIEALRCGLLPLQGFIMEAPCDVGLAILSEYMSLYKRAHDLVTSRNGHKKEQPAV